MEIKYLGPMNRVIVAPYGDHFQGQIKEYPDDFGKELLATSKKQKFERIDGGPQTEDGESVESVDSVDSVRSVDSVNETDGSAELAAGQIDRTDQSDGSQPTADVGQSLEDKTVPELLKMLKDRKIEVRPKMRKAELIKMLTG